MDLCKFKGSLVYIVSSRTAGAKGDPVSKREKKKKKKKKERKRMVENAASGRALA